MKDDPTIERIRKVRHEISEMHHHDPEQLIHYYERLQKKYEDRLMQTAAPPWPRHAPQKDK